MNSSFQANNLMDNGSSLLQQMYLISIDSSQRHFNKQLIVFQLESLQRQEDTQKMKRNTEETTDKSHKNTKPTNKPTQFY